MFGQPKVGPPAPLPTSEAESTMLRAPMVPPAGSGPTEGQMCVADRVQLSCTG